jgi:glutamine synthetase
MRLHQVIKSAKQKHDIDFLCGFEIEFVIMHPAKDDHPARVVQTDVNFYSSASIRNPYLEIIEEIIHCLLNAGVKVRQFHSEGWSGMFELSTGKSSPILFIPMQNILPAMFGIRGLV